jgi:hypothetical protein
MTKKEIKFRGELLELLKKHGVRVKKDRVYYPGDDEAIGFLVPPDSDGGYQTELTMDDIAEDLGGWVKK